MSLRAKILVSLVGLLVIVGTLVVGAIRLGNAQEENAARVSRSLTDRMAPARELAALAKDIRYHVVQVQQFITDASATGELGDDEKAAAEHAATFTRNAARAAIVARTLGATRRQPILWPGCRRRSRATTTPVAAWHMLMSTMASQRATC